MAILSFVIHPETYNSNQRPDFTEAKIKINDTLGWEM
jgi:hypothetical protein